MNLKPSDLNRENELDGELHRTREDAFRVVQQARVSSLVAAHSEYLKGLIEFLDRWREEIAVQLIDVYMANPED